MIEPLYFGEPQRSLFGALHRARRSQRRPMLMCTPLLQDGIRSHRVLRVIAEGLAEAGVDTLRFDWYGSGDSAGDSGELSLPGLLLDLREANALLGSVVGGARPRGFALRSSAVPLLLHAAGQTEPAELILWDPCLLGHELVADWRGQHSQQLEKAGRYPGGHAEPSPDDLLGFDVRPGLLASIDSFDGRYFPLPPGSRVLMAVWEFRPEHERFVDSLRGAGTAVEWRTLEIDDRPSFDDPNRFESQALPRRSAAQLVRWLTDGDWS